MNFRHPNLNTHIFNVQYENSFYFWDLLKITFNSVFKLKFYFKWALNDIKRNLNVKTVLNINQSQLNVKHF